MSRSGTEIMLEPVSVRRRILYLNEYNVEHSRWGWTCPMCGERFEGNRYANDKAQVQREVDAHACGAGWCALRHVPR